MKKIVIIIKSTAGTTVFPKDKHCRTFHFVESNADVTVYKYNLLYF